MSEPRHRHVVNVADVEGRTMSKGARFGATMKRLGPLVGAKSLGCTHYRVEPGRAAFPFHFHCVTEEAIFVLAGEGTLRIGEERVALGTGDFVALPVGPETAHQLINTGSVPLEYLVVSTAGHTGEVVGYPDSKKVAAMAAPSSEAAMKGQHWVRFIAREGTSLDYYDGEEID